VFDQVRDRDGARQTDQQMHVIDMASHRRADTSTFLDVVGQHSEHLIAKGFLPEKVLSFFGRENDVQPDLSVRLWHGVTIRLFVANGRAVGPHGLYCSVTQPVGLG